MKEGRPIGEGSRTAAAFQRAQQEARVRSSGVGIPAYPSRSAPRSGIMPDATGMVLCPHCRKAFPFGAALLNRQIRCNGCRGVFRVSDDRRSFKLQPPPPIAQLSAEAVGTASKATRLAIQSANENLNETARQALKAIDRKGAPIVERAVPASDSSLPAESPGMTTTRRIARVKKAEAVLNGTGVTNARSRSAWLIACAVIAVAVLTVLLLLRPDPRQAALLDFETAGRLDQTWGERVAELRSRSLSREVEPIVSLHKARISAPIVLDLTGMRRTLTGMRVLKRGALWVEASRHGEATAMMSSVPTPDALAARCRKAGITVRTWDEVIAAASAGLPADTIDVIQLILDRPAPRHSGMDPVGLIDLGSLPDQMAICPFGGSDGSLLQPTGPARSTAYRGRLIRCTGKGWPDGWQVLDLTAVR